MLRSSLRSARVLGGKPVVAVARRQWPIAVSRSAGYVGNRCYVDQKKPGADASKAPVLPTSETQSSDRTPPATIDDVGETKIKQSEIPMTPPAPPPARVSQAAHPGATSTGDDVGESKVLADKIPMPPTPPPAPKKKGFFRRLRNFVFTLMVLGAVGFGGGVWYSRINDNFHDFFTEYVPFGEQAVLYLEEMEFRKRFPNTTTGSSRKAGGPGDQVTIPAQSGASWRVADDETRHSSAAPKSRMPKSKQPPKPEGKSGPTTPPAPESPATTAKAPEKAPPSTAAASKSDSASSKGFKAPEVNEPSKFPPLEPIDLMTLSDAKEPVIQDLVHMLNGLIMVINADGAHGKYGTTIEKAKNDVSKVGRKLKAMKGAVEKKAAAEVRTSLAEFDGAATEMVRRVERTMATQEARWREEFETEMQSIRESHDKQTALVLERERKLNDEKIRNQLLEQAVALKKEFVSEVKARVEKEREGRLGQLDELSSAVSSLEKLTVGWNDVVDSNLQTQQLHVAVEAVRASLEDSQHPRPFIRELVALKEIASDDPVVDAAIASVNPSAYQRGIPTPSQLIDRFRRVAGEVRKASLLPDDAGVASHASSWVLSHVMFKKQGLAEGGDVESILTRTQTYLEEGDLDAAAREMNGLQGWAKTLSKDWMGEVRKVLEVQQALDVIATQARLQSLRVD